MTTLFHRRTRLIRLLGDATRSGVLRWHADSPPGWVIDAHEGVVTYHSAIYPQAEHPWLLGLLARTSFVPSFSYMLERIAPDERRRLVPEAAEDAPDVSLLLFVNGSRQLRIADMIVGADVLPENLLELWRAACAHAVHQEV